MTYSTPTFTQKAVDIIQRYTPASPNPLFLYLPYQNVHWPLEAPEEYVRMFANSTGGNHARNMVTCAWTAPGAPPCLCIAHRAVRWCGEWRMANGGCAGVRYG